MGVVQFKRDKRISEEHRKELREHCSEAGRKIDDLARKLGLYIDTGPLPHGYRAALVSSPRCGSSSGYRIVVNERLPLEQRNVSIAHELGHFVLHRDDRNFKVLTERQIQSLLRGYDLEDSCDVGEVLRFVPNSFSGTDTPYDWALEREANDFAACILLPENLVRKSASFRRREIVTLAREFRVPVSFAHRQAEKTISAIKTASHSLSSTGTAATA